MVYLFIGGIIIAGFIFYSLLLHFVTKTFNISGVSFKKTLMICIYQCVATLLTTLLFSFILSFLKLEKTAVIFSAIIELFIFHKLFQKYYQTNFKKNLSIYIVFTITYAILSVIVVVVIRSYVFSPFYVKGAAMEPTLKDNDYLIINQISKKYNRGDIIVFRYPLDPQKYFIERIIGLPGEKIQIKDGLVHIFNNSTPDGYTLSEPYLEADLKTYSNDDTVVELAEDEYYVLGDNRGESKDSRSFGAVGLEFFTGKIWLK